MVGEAEASSPPWVSVCHWRRHAGGGTGTRAGQDMITCSPIINANTCNHQCQHVPYCDGH